ncbi:MAG: (E)-4-hydroxy-3-methylbut-2-enyl-diphosphate synthase [Muribaculaceae bacterium]|nr:(E)-4-hydroxy-3-methylbut-2-enyl-diphosphate synthase [Muribaculaceae bacterium]
MSMLNYRRRPTVTVTAGGTPMGSDYPVRVQSMTNTSTMDTDGSLNQIKALANAGACYVRLTAQGEREARNIGVMGERLRAEGLRIPLVADIHFNPRAAMAAAQVVDKVRINPGNFVDPGRTFRHLEYTDEEYAREVNRIEARLLPLLDLCRSHGTAIRIGVNHGSLSDRIMSRYGDTPAGMVESAMEFLRICVKHNFMEVVISIKASNTVVMVETVRRLVKAMDAEQMHFPLHLGVTEAGDGEDGRIKSAVGIGTLLAQGIGDTIRVSLSEDPVAEIPVAELLCNYISARAEAPAIEEFYIEGYDTESPSRLTSESIGRIGGQNPTIVIVDGDDPRADYNGTSLPTDVEWMEIDASTPIATVAEMLNGHDKAVVILTSSHPNAPAELQAMSHRLKAAGITNPVIMKLGYNDTDAETVAIKSAADFGAILLNGHADGIWLSAPELTAAETSHIAFGILQATRRRITRTEYISCPGCGRTLFDLQATVKAVKAATSHLTGLKIGIMGCIVNGPGEMADADYGYVGAAAGHVSLYKGKECVEKNLTPDEAIIHLLDLIKANGDWKDE